MSLPKISIVTPSFNQGQYIEETILSIINQNYPNLEYIIIDGGSTDNTVEIIKKYEQHLAYWVSEKDKGQSEAINKGFRKATGDIVCWINSDDFFMPGSLLKVGERFAKDDSLDLLNGHCLLIDEHSNILSNHFILKQKKWYAERGIYYVSQPSMFWRRKILDEVGLLREDFHAVMDKELLIRIFKNDFKIGHINKILAAFRMHSTSKSFEGVSKIFLRDSAELVKMYGNYGRKPKPLFKLVYRLEKIVRGVYLKKWLFDMQWRGKKASELNYQNSSYLK
jgi:glycosyltransferase involved in cell wall biosynthesis